MRAAVYVERPVVALPVSVRESVQAPQRTHVLLCAHTSARLRVATSMNQSLDACACLSRL